MRKRTHAQVVAADALLHGGAYLVRVRGKGRVGVRVGVGVGVGGIAAYHRAQERRGHAECRHAGAPRLVRVRVRVRVRRLGLGLG